MLRKTFKAMVVRQADDNKFVSSIIEKSVDDLPPGDILIRTIYSSLNYKDALSASGHRGVTRNYRHTPGIDAAGVVEESISDNFHSGTEISLDELDIHIERILQGKQTGRVIANLQRSKV